MKDEGDEQPSGLTDGASLLNATTNKIHWLFPTIVAAAVLLFILIGTAATACSPSHPTGRQNVEAFMNALIAGKPYTDYLDPG